MNRSNVRPHVEINFNQYLQNLKMLISAYRRNVGLHPTWNRGYDTQDDWEYNREDPYYRNLHEQIWALEEIREGRPEGYFPW